MKKFILFIALVVTIAASAQTVEKQTFVYSVQGTDSLRLDRYTALTDDSALRPCMLFVFGGGFVAGTRDNPSYTSYFEYYARKGFTVVSIDYRLGLKMAIESGMLTDQGAFQAAWLQTLAMATEDLYDATAYVLQNAAAWGVNPKAVVASGSSAGAITVLMGEYGICNGSVLAQRLPKGFNYAGVISYAGAIFDIGDELRWTMAPAPIMLFHGDADANVPYDVVREFGAGFFGSKYIAAQLSKKRIPHYFYSVTNDDHSLATRPMFENRYEIDTFLEKLVFGGQRLVIDTYVTPLDAPGAPKNFTLEDYIKTNFAPQ